MKYNWLLAKPASSLEFWPLFSDDYGLPCSGSVSLFLWTLYFLKSASEFVNYVFFQVLDKLSSAIHGHVDQRQEDSIPV